MDERIPVLLQLHSNIERYQITFYDCHGAYQKIIYGREESICFCTCSPCFRITVTPLTDGYTGSRYFFIDACCQSSVCLSFQFTPITPSPTTAINRFTLTDANYGLPIDGVLTFTGA